MTGYNKVILVGNITADPELRKLPSGESVTDLGLAVNEKFRNKEGELIEKTCFADISVWGKQAESCCKYLTKGAPILAEGRLQLDRWETPEGEKRSKLRVKADKIRFMGGKAEAAENGHAGQPAENGVNGDGEEHMPF